MRRKRRNKRNKVISGVIISLCALIAIYLGMSIYFTNHLYFGSVINGINVSGKTVEEANKEISSKIETYALELEERGDNKEEIKGTDIDLKYDDSKVKDLKNSQNPFAWLPAIFNKKDSQLSQIVTYDENQLKEQLDKLSCVNSSNITEPQNASFQYTDNGYEVVNEVNGNKVNKDALYDQASNAVLKAEPKLNLESSNCYENPKYTSDSKEVADAKDVLNQYTNLTITYSSGDHKEVLDGSTIHNWLGVDENMQVTFDEKKVAKYVSKISSVYNTFGNTRNFTATSGATIKVSGGNYGWIVDNSKEVKDLIETIKKGQTTTKEPIYAQTAISREANDIGNTYVEIDMTKQHLWFYKNGSLVVEGDVVTGNLTNNTSTPPGTYRLNYKEKNATLKGEDYESAVTFWMPFNGNIGIHDASWRSQFGGNIYLSSGSHGCVNSPYYLANTIYDNIEAGTPIVCYYE